MKEKSYAARVLFFPAAAIHALLILPLSVHAMTSGKALLPGLANSAQHGHEMLFGFSLAVVTGFLVNRISGVKLGVLFGLWLSARCAFLLLPNGIASHIVNAVFAVYFSAMIAPQFLSAAKKWRNQIFAPTVLALSIALVGFHASGIFDHYGLQRFALQEAVLLLALLMAFMGGRIIAPAVAGHFQAEGLTLNARVQPRLEAALLMTMLGALVAATIPALDDLTGVLLALAAAVSLLRLLRWRLWWCAKRPDLLCLGAGYAWLVVGLALLSASYFSTRLSPTLALHGVTVGALGTLTLTVMVRTRMIKARRHPGLIPGLAPAAILISLAAIMRLAAASSPTALLVAAMLWSIAFALALMIFVRTPAPAPRASQRQQV